MSPWFTTHPRTFESCTQVEAQHRDLSSIQSNYLCALEGRRLLIRGISLFVNSQRACRQYDVVEAMNRREKSSWPSMGHGRINKAMRRCCLQISLKCDEPLYVPSDDHHILWGTLRNKTASCQLRPFRLGDGVSDFRERV
jgi:hypothetical protein